jgi:DNA-binding MarR family transcriptional regulator
MNFEQVYPFLLDRTMRQLRRISQQRLNEAGADLTVEQWVTLYGISQDEGVSQTELSNGTFKDAPTTTRIIDALVKKNLVFRKMDDNDRRRFNLHLSKEGRELVAKILPVVEGIRADGWKNLTKQDFQMLKRILDTVYANCGGE